MEWFLSVNQEKVILYSFKKSAIRVTAFSHFYFKYAFIFRRLIFV